MELKEITEKISRSAGRTSATRDESSQMLVFGRENQWADDFGDHVRTRFRGQFDIIKPRRNKILAELWANPASVSFKPRDGADPDAGGTLAGLYRADVTQRGEEAYETAVMDMVDCGNGAFRLVTEYASKFNDLDDTLRIGVAPINEANNRVFWDDNSTNKDRSDAMWCCILTPFTESGWERYCDQIGVDYEEYKNPSDFMSPSSSSIGGGRRGGKKEEFNIGEFYFKEMKRERVVIYEDPFGQRKAYYKSEIENVKDELVLAGFNEIGRKWKDRYVVKKYICTGLDVVKETVVAGEYIPVIQFFGDWSFVEGREVWRGIYHDAQDQLRLNNALMSYLADIVMLGPREKDIFLPEQIMGHEWMYQDSGVDNDLPYLLQNAVGQDGSPLPLGAVGKQTPPGMPPALTQLMTLIKENTAEVTGGSMSMDQMMSSQVTEGQIRAAQQSSNLEAFLFQNSAALAMKHCGRVYASMAQEIHVMPQEATIVGEDGTEQQVMIMETVFDEQTGEEVVLNDLTKGSFDVYVDTGPSYMTQREQSQTELRLLAGELKGTPEGQLALLSYLATLTGPGSDGMAKYARRQLVIQGIEEPKTEEEEVMIAQLQQQPPQPDPAMVMALAEQEKGQSDKITAISNAQSKATDNQIKAYKAETERVRVLAQNNLSQAQAEKAASEVTGNELDNVGKVAAALMPAPMRVQ